MWMVVCHRHWHCRISIVISIGLFVQLLLLQSTQVLKKEARAFSTYLRAGPLRHPKVMAFNVI